MAVTLRNDGRLASGPTVQIRYGDAMTTGTLVKQARLRAGFTQAELAHRTGTTQSAIARVERGASEPSLERVRTLIRACGFDLDVSVVVADEAELASLRRNLELTPDERVRRVVNLARFVQAGRSALGAADG